MTYQHSNDILLETGTNEIEVMEFTIGDNVFGINVAKVKEIMMPSSVKFIPHLHPCVEGIFKSRDNVITVVNLPLYLNMKSIKKTRDLFIITNFNNALVAFRVNSVIGIARMSWSKIEKPDKIICSADNSVTTGIAQVDNTLINILDFEKIITDIAPKTSINVSELDGLYDNRIENDTLILLVEDSPLLSKLIIECLAKAKYMNIQMCNNGEEAIEYINSINEAHLQIGLIITDIEMPQMDGHRLTKLIKSDSILKSIPIIIFSSLINDAMYQKGLDVGANEQLSKPEIKNLVNIVDRFVGNNYKK